MFDSIDDAEQRLQAAGYFATREVATAVFLGGRLGKALFLEGQHGTGKTSLAESIADAYGSPLLRVQCHEGLSPAQATYEWDVARQILEARVAADRGESIEPAFGAEYILKLPFLASITAEGPVGPVLLVDEIDRATGEFQAFLQDFLADYALTIPHVGLVQATVPPLVIITSNGQGDVSEALRNQCLYLWLEYPGFVTERDIVLAKVPAASSALAGQVCNVINAMRASGFVHPPGVAETIDWVRALVALHRDSVDHETMDQTLGCVLKSANDMERFRRDRLWEMLQPHLDAAG